ncbi:hypothetical protein BTR22_19080 [Alkalihalophilus pseudofirmus]|uniref:zinc-finger domain-containing protein n=1 Tax=Alkalihalophilus pseudofirmus TaxID=79885 RepID=UPI0009529B80|nr:hypothetical protein BTR22_19080 [Alkalihalophilus pseudofirmus]
MCRKTILQTIDTLQSEHCESCTHLAGAAGNQAERLFHDVCKKCVIGKQIIQLGKGLTAGHHQQQQHHWSNEETFYAVNHIEVLGIAKGVEQVANRLEIDPYYVEVHYFRQKEKAHHTSVV